MKTTLTFFLLCSLTNFHAQELAVFTIADFDLKGPVKNCTVITDYGKESFEFDRNGTLLKIITQYNTEDQDITLYKFEGNRLVERRMESYKNGVLDPMTSMANLYSYDTLGTEFKIVEKIVSYDKTFMEDQEYTLNKEGAIEKIVISNQDGVDEKRVEYSQYQREKTTSYLMNGVLEQTVRISVQTNKKGQSITTNLTKEYVDGLPNSAKETKTYEDGRLMSTEDFQLDPETGQLASYQKSTFVYSADKVLHKELTKRGNAVFEKEYIFQFDDHEPKNWVKKIVTPENSYTTRIITYYEDTVVSLKTED